MELKWEANSVLYLYLFVLIFKKANDLATELPVRRLVRAGPSVIPDSSIKLRKYKASDTAEHRAYSPDSALLNAIGP